MKTLLSLVASILMIQGITAQTQVNLADLEFEKTDHPNIIYNQYAANTNLSVSTNTSQKIYLDLGAGNAEIYGSKNQELSVQAEIIVTVKNKKKIAQIVNEKLDLRIDVEDDLVRLTSTFGYEDSESDISKGFFASPERKVNLKIYLPVDLPVKAVDHSGDILVHNIRNDLTLNDGSGGIEIDGLVGSLNLLDRSGEIIIRDINAGLKTNEEVNIKDYSGGIYLRDIGGNTIIDDASGEIDVRSVHGSLEIRDTSGGIYAKKITGDSRVVDTSGEIIVFEIDGNVILSDTSGGIYVDNVTKDVTLKRDGSGSFSAKNVQGRVTGNWDR